MSNGNNDWGVQFSRISFLDKILSTHGNVSNVDRDHDIKFTIDRANPNDQLTIICVDEYACGLMIVRRAIEEFGKINMVFVGGNWNGYTPEAKEFCLDEKIGLYNASEVSGGLWKRDHWDYAQCDDKGNKTYHYRDAE
jgi:hypothetical protein